MCNAQEFNYCPTPEEQQERFGISSGRAALAAQGLGIKVGSEVGKEALVVQGCARGVELKIGVKSAHF